MKHLLIAGFVLLIYQHGVIVEERKFKTHQECVQAKHKERRKSGCVREHRPNKSRVRVAVEDLKVGSGV